MELSASIKASLSGRYAAALFELASEAGKVTAVENDLAKVAAATRESSELRAMVRNPTIGREALARVLAGVAEMLQLDPLTRNFLGVLAQNRRVLELGAVIRDFQAIASAQRGEVAAEVTSAHPLTDEQVAALENKLRAREGRTVKLQTIVDPDLLGGLVVTIGSQRIDNSIRTRLNSLAQAMKG